MTDGERHPYARFDALIARHRRLIDNLCMLRADGDANRCAEPPQAEIIYKIYKISQAPRASRRLKDNNGELGELNELFLGFNFGRITRIGYRPTPQAQNLQDLRDFASTTCEQENKNRRPDNNPNVKFWGLLSHFDKKFTLVYIEAHLL